MALQIARTPALAAAFIAGSASLAMAQPRMNRGPNPDAPKLMVSACATTDKVLAVQCADRIRSQIEGDVSFRNLLVISKNDIESTLTASGYDPALALAPGDAMALAKQVHADFYVTATVERNGSNLKVNAAVVLARDANMKQPLGEYEHARIETISGQVSKAFQDVFNKTFDRQKDCFTRERERKYDDALKAVNDGLREYPGSLWLRHCKLAVLKSQRASGTEVAALLEEIVAADQSNKAALRDLVVIYDTEGNQEKKLATLEALRAADPSDARLTADIINSLAGMGQFDKARPIAEKAVAENPGDINIIRPYWLIVMTLKDYKLALEVGKKMATMDTSTADTSYFNRMMAAANADSNFAEAADLADKAAAKFPQVQEYHTYAVGLWRKAGNNAKSVAAAQRALRVHPKMNGMRAAIGAAYLANATVGAVDTAIALVKEMIANGEDKDQIAGVAVQAGNVLLTNFRADSMKARGADDAAIRAMTIRTYEVLAWADTLAVGTSVALQGKFLFGVAAMTVGQQVHMAEVGAIGAKLQEDFKAAAGNAARQTQIINEANPRACAAIGRAADYFIVARGAIPAGGRFAPQQAQQLMGSLGQLDGYVDQVKKSYKCQ